ncbi:hypothetical protein GH714_026220 [Hevea brasiliensis]|uniref:Homeobox protein knotted-1-like 1 n=1 Tax=Hevea brasiliensis TaxID=3981 RepID=A0A6A6M3C1_HEVBR|nr:hypothetical protein GH714_026220 [Hevea brasiliensis]
MQHVDLSLELVLTQSRMKYININLIKMATLIPDNSSPGRQGELEEAGLDSAEAQFRTEIETRVDLIKTQIANHPRYPDLVSAYIECQKVGAPPEMASLLEEIGGDKYSIKSCCSDVGADPELDEFMESYCEVLHRYKEELSRPFDEATTFLGNIELQLSNLCKGTLTKTFDYYASDEAAGTSDEELSCGEVEASESQESSGGGRPCDEDLKGMLLRKYSGYLSNLRKEFSKKRKKGKLPKDARMILLDWWNNHYRWPYPTEEEKVKLSEITGLDQKQINNWFINQRKRHWKPSEDMRFAFVESVSSSMGGHSYFDTEGGARGD